MIADLGQAWRPFGGAGFLVLIGFLGVSVVVSTLLILIPLYGRRALRGDGGGESREGLGAISVYFLALGLGFLWLEIPLMQRFILLLDQPTYSFSVVLFAVLVFSGVGSLASAKLGGYRRWAILALGLLALLYAVLTEPLMHLVLGLPLIARMLVVVLATAPLAFLMGVPFPAGIAALAGRRSALIPWAWGANGYASVVGATLASIIVLIWGFTVVMLAAGAVYLIALGAFSMALNDTLNPSRKGQTGPAPC